MNFSKKNYFKYPITKFFSQAPSSGFTLIELLVVFSIISVLSGVGFASLVTYGRSQQLNQTANDVKLLISQARFNALSSVKNNSTPNGQFDCGNNDMSSYGINELPNNQIELREYCSGGSSAQIKIIAFPKNLTFANVAQCSSVQFASLSSQATGVPCDIVITGANGQNKTISIDATGNVSVH